MNPKIKIYIMTLCGQPKITSNRQKHTVPVTAEQAHRSRAREGRPFLPVMRNRTARDSRPDSRPRSRQPEPPGSASPDCRATGALGLPDKARATTLALGPALAGVPRSWSYCGRGCSSRIAWQVPAGVNGDGAAGRGRRARN